MTKLTPLFGLLFDDVSIALDDKPRSDVTVRKRMSIALAAACVNSYRY